MSSLDLYFGIFSEGAGDQDARKHTQTVFKRVQKALGSIKPTDLKVSTTKGKEGDQNEPVASVNLGKLLSMPDMDDLDLRFVRSNEVNLRGVFRPFKVGNHKIDINVGIEKPEPKPGWTSAGGVEDTRPSVQASGELTPEQWKKVIAKNAAKVIDRAEEIFYHEFTHYMDFKRIHPDKRGEVVKNTPAMGKDAKQKQAHYSSPLEFNAFLQQGLSKIEAYLDGKASADIKKTIGGSADEFYKRVLKVLTLGFAKNLDAKYQAKLKKRVAQAYTDITQGSGDKA